MDKILKKAAEILVECGYATCLPKCPAKLREEAPEWHDAYDATHIMKSGKDFNYQADPFSDTLEGRRQADAIEDWLWWQENSLWKKSEYAVRESLTCNENQHQWRLDRIKFCLEQLVEDNE